MNSYRQVTVRYFFRKTVTQLFLCCAVVQRCAVAKYLSLCQNDYYLDRQKDLEAQFKSYYFFNFFTVKPFESLILCRIHPFHILFHPYIHQYHQSKKNSIASFQQQILFQLLKPVVMKEISTLNQIKLIWLAHVLRFLELWVYCIRSLLSLDPFGSLW